MQDYTGTNDTFGETELISFGHYQAPAGYMPTSPTHSRLTLTCNPCRVPSTAGTYHSPALICLPWQTFPTQSTCHSSRLPLAAATYFPTSPPARTAYAVQDLPLGAKVEIEVVALA